VPVNIVKKIVADIIEFGSVQRAVLGVTITDVTDELAKEINLESIEGVYISGVAENGAAQAAGIEPGDVIISINGVKVNSVSELQEQVSRYRPKDKVDVVVKRNNREKQFEVVLRNMEGEARYITAETNVLGAKFRDVDRNLKKRLQIDNGVQITELGEGALQDAGIKNNFVITSIDGEPVESAAQVKNILARQPKGSSVEIEGIYPGGRYIYVYVVKF